MEFRETPIFTKQINGLLSDDELRRLQVSLMLRPDAGAIIKGGGGLRKVRWKAQGRGKSGGIRVIYYYELPDTIYMLLAYPKNKQENITPSQLKVLKTLMEEYLK